MPQWNWVKSQYFEIHVHFVNITLFKIFSSLIFTCHFPN